MNINYGKNQKLMDACESFKEYAWLVESVRRHQREKMDLDAAVDAALDGMPDTFLIKEFVLGNRSEVKSMFLTEYNEEKIMEKEQIMKIQGIEVSGIGFICTGGFEIDNSHDFILVDGETLYQSEFSC